MHHLHTLDLSHNEIGDEGVILLVEIVESYLTNLQVLLLNSNNFTNIGAKFLAEKVVKLSKLYTLKFDLKIGAHAQCSIVGSNKSATKNHWGRCI